MLYTGGWIMNSMELITLVAEALDLVTEILNPVPRSGGQWRRY